MRITVIGARLTPSVEVFQDVQGMAISSDRTLLIVRLSGDSIRRESAEWSQVIVNVTGADLAAVKGTT